LTGNSGATGTSLTSGNLGSFITTATSAALPVSSLGASPIMSIAIPAGVWIFTYSVQPFNGSGTTTITYYQVFAADIANNPFGIIKSSTSTNSIQVTTGSNTLSLSTSFTYSGPATVVTLFWSAVYTGTGTPAFLQTYFNAVRIA